MRVTKPRLLLVEDDRALADLLIWHFEREGYEIDRTADGEEALILAQERTPDLVILDWMIEGVTGIEVCRRLRRKATDGARADHHADRARRGERPHSRPGNRRR